MTEETKPEGNDDRTRVVPRTTPLDDSATVITSGQPTRTNSPLFAPTNPPTNPATGPSQGTPHEAGLLPVGSRLAEFEITRIIGQGGFGVVYEAWDHTLERVVAIKEYLPSSLSTRQGDGSVVPLSERHRETFDLGMRSFINEARLLAQFDHPSLLKVYRFWQERGTTYMVMPFYRGDTLRQALVSIPAGVDEAWLVRIMDGVTQALGVMHGANCYHRDIAPDNIILLEGSGRPVVLDFGAARRVITDKTQAITVILKPGYAPIEQYAEMPDMSQGAWTDVYALAAVMHVAVCGRAPPPSVARLLSDSYVPLAGNEILRQRYSPQLLAAIDAGLGVRPEARPQSMAELRAALGLETSQSIAPPAHPSQHSRGTSAAPGPNSRSGGGGKTVVLPSAPAPSAGTRPGGNKTAVALVSVALLAAAAGFEVTASAKKPEVAIGKDKLAFEVRSKRDGFVYVFLLSSGGEMFLLFPNLLDKYNKITAGSPLALPRASWPMEAGGPAGTNQFAVLVSEHERDFGASGVQNEGVFPQFPLPVLAALETTRGSGPSPLLGKPVCAPNTPCNDVYGVANFKIVEK